MESATTSLITITKIITVKAEPKTIRTANVHESARLPWRCQ